MRILQINKFLYPKGGTETHLLALINLLSKNDQEIVCFSQKNLKNIPCTGEQYFIDNLDLSQLSLNTVGKLPRIFWSFKARRLVKKLIKENRPDIVHIHNIYHQISPSILPLFRQAGIPVVMTVHDFKLIAPSYTLRADGVSLPHKNSRLIESILKLEFAWHQWLDVYRENIDWYIAPSEFVKIKLIENGFSAEKIQVIPHFLPAEFLKKSRSKIKKTTTEKYLLAYGRLDEGKGFSDLIKVFAELNITGLKLKIAGDGPNKEQLTKLIKDLGLKKTVELVGQKSQAQIVELIKGAKVVVNCSKLHETFGLTVLEAMALGKPIIASKVGAIPELITHGKNGLLYQVADAGDLKKQLLKITGSEALRLKLGAAAKLTATNYSEKRYLPIILSVYAKTLKNYQTPVKQLKANIFYLVMFIFFALLLIIPLYHLNINNSSAVIFPNQVNNESNYPRLANLYWSNPITPDIAKKLAQWDLLILDMTAQNYSADQIRSIRKINPQIIILAYTSATEMPTDRLNAIEPDGQGLWHDLASGDDKTWHLKNYQGQDIVFWPGNVMMNLGTKNSAGQTYGDYLTNFYQNNILSSGLWDGLFFDTTWKNISWLDKRIDIDSDGKKDLENKINYEWQNANLAFFAQLRNRIGTKYLIITNGDGEYDAYANGRMFEGFPETFEGGWTGSIKRYQTANNFGFKPRLNIINSDTNNTGKQTDYQTMRFGLMSALLFDGYYSFDYGTNLREQLWWYDEFDVKLGKPLNTAENRLSQNGLIETGVWQRTYEKGLILVNSTNQEQAIQLSQKYQKIVGTQDAVTNSGEVLSSVTIPAQDGIILLKLAN